MILNITDVVPALAETYRHHTLKAAKDGGVVDLDGVCRAMDEIYQRYTGGDRDLIVGHAKTILSKLEKKDYEISKTLQEYFREVLLRRKQECDGILESDDTTKESREAAIALMDAMGIAENDYRLVPISEGYADAYLYICGMIDYPLRAMQHYGLDTGELLYKAQELAGEWYARPDDWRKQIDDKSLFDYINRLEAGRLFPLSSSSGAHMTMELLAAGRTRLSQYQARKPKISHGAAVSIDRQGKARRITQSKEKQTITVTINNMDPFNDKRPQGKKFFLFVFWKIGTQCVSGGKITKDKITFPLKELLEIGLYDTTDGARRGFYNLAAALKLIEIDYVKNGKSDAALRDRKNSSLFVGYEIDRGQCSIDLNPHFKSWPELVGQYYMMLPRYYFSLSSRASDLLYQIHYLARQRKAEITKKGYFTIQYTTICFWLYLPDPDETKNPQRDITDEINKAIDEIAKRNDETGGGLELIEHCEDNGGGIRNFLSSSYLEVRISGEYADKIMEIDKAQTRKIAAKKAVAEKRKAKAAESGE